MYPDVCLMTKIVVTGSFKKVPMGCRSFLQGWKDENGSQFWRMNLKGLWPGQSSPGIYFLGIEAETRKFWQIFNERMNIAEDALFTGWNARKEATPANAPILYQYGAFGETLGQVRSGDQPSVIASCFAWLYWTLWSRNRFCRSKLEHNPKLTIHDRYHQGYESARGSDQYDYHFSIYSTPSEDLTDRFCRLDTEGGKGSGYHRQEYYTNSFHCDVRKNPTSFSWILKKYIRNGASGGLSTTVNTYYPTRKSKSPLKQFGIMPHDRVGYLGTNTPIDRSLQVWFWGDFTYDWALVACQTVACNSDQKRCGQTDLWLSETLKLVPWD